MSNSSLAARISALVDKWNGYKNALRDLLTKATGTVTMEDGNGAMVTLPTIPALQATVTALVDSATGAVAGSQAAASSAAMSAGAAQNAQDAAEGFKKDAAASATSIATTQAAVEATAVTAGNSAATAVQKATDAAASAATALTQADTASTAQRAASASAVDAGTSAANSQSSAAEAMAWAMTAQTSVTGLLVYRGAFDASSGAFPANPAKGDFWKVSGAGVLGGIDLNAGDQIIYSGTGWDKIDNTESVTSVAGRIGNVTLTWTDIGGKPSTYTPSGHTHAMTDVVGLQAALDAKAPKDSPTFTGGVVVSNNALRLSGWGGTDTNGVIYFGSANSYIYKSGGAFSFNNEQMGGSADLNSTGTIWTSGNQPVNAAASSNTLVKRDQNGYVYANFFNTTANFVATTPSHIAIQTSSDNYIRWQTPADFKTQMKLCTDGTLGENTLTAAALQSTTLRSGFFKNDGQGLLNAAGNATALGGWWHVINNYHDVNGFGSQIATELSSSGQNQMWMRSSSGNSWREWSQVAMLDRNVAFGGSVTAAALGIGGEGSYLIADSGLRATGAFRVTGDSFLLAANGAAWIRNPRTFVQGGDPGAMAQDGDLWVW